MQIASESQTRLKRNWPEQGRLDAQHEQAKKAKIEAEKQAEVQEKKSRTLEQFESNESKVSEGAGIETSSENKLTFDDPNLKDSPAFRTKKKHKQVSPWDASTPTTSSKTSTHRTRVHRALQHAKNGLIRFVRYWTFGSLMRVILLLVALARFFKVENDVAVALSAELRSNKKNVSCEAYICDHLRSSLQILKRCESEEQRTAHYVVLTAVGPETGHKEPVAIWPVRRAAEVDVEITA